MRLLLTNDDGIDGEGLQVLAEVLRKEHDVWIIAPDRNRSAVSNGLTMNRALEIRKVGEQMFTSSGLPADCVSTGVFSNLVKGKIDMVVSGINRGANLGTDIIYSGTAAAARQAVLLGIPGVALSIHSPTDEFKYTALADFALKNLSVLKELYTPGIFLNINALSRDSYKAVQFTNVSVRKYKDTVTVKNTESGVMLSSFEGGAVTSEGSMDSDYFVVENGNISITRIVAEPVSLENTVGAKFLL